MENNTCIFISKVVPIYSSFLGIHTLEISGQSYIFKTMSISKKALGLHYFLLCYTQIHTSHFTLGKVQHNHYMREAGCEYTVLMLQNYY